MKAKSIFLRDHQNRETFSLTDQDKRKRLKLAKIKNEVTT